MARSDRSTQDDFKTVWRILKGRVGIVISIVTGIIAISGASFTVYNHFAKEYELVRNNCIRQAIDLDTKTDIQVAKHETMINIAETILRMFDNVQMEDAKKIAWTIEWNRVVTENTKNLNYVLKQPRYYTPELIDDCSKSETHVIQSRTGGIDMDKLLKGLGSLSGGN